MYSILLSVTLLGSAPQSATAVPAESLLVSAEWLRARRAEPGLVVLNVDHRMGSAPGPAPELIPGSLELDYMAIIAEVGGVASELPSLDSLRRVFEGLGVSGESRVVLYSRDPIMAARAFMTLEALGHERVHLLDGGVTAWKAAGGTVVAGAATPAARGRLVPRPREVVVAADWVRAHLDDPATALIDTRTPGEYTGTGERRGIPSEGHLAGARLLVWQELFREGNPLFKPREELLRMFQERGAAHGKTVVTYCYLGYRASLTYFVARYLGYDTRIYDGSYNEWALKRYPLVRGEAPR